MTAHLKLMMVIESTHARYNRDLRTVFAVVTLVHGQGMNGKNQRKPNCCIESRPRHNTVYQGPKSLSGGSGVFFRSGKRSRRIATNH